MERERENMRKRDRQRKQSRGWENVLKQKCLCRDWGHQLPVLPNGLGTTKPILERHHHCMWWGKMILSVILECSVMSAVLFENVDVCHITK